MANSEKQISASPFAYANNNPILYIDPDGREWKTKKDEDEAKELRENSKDRIRTHTQTIVNVGKQITALESSDMDKNSNKYKKKLQKLKREDSNAKASIKEVNSFISEIDALGADTTNKFTFRETGFDHGFIGKDSDGAITINHLKGIGNKAHETRHAFQYLQGDVTFNEKLNPVIYPRGLNLSNKGVNTRQKNEVSSYKIQFALEPSSMEDAEVSRPVHINYVRKWYNENVNQKN